MQKRPIYVTQPSLPPLNEFLPYLEKIWDSKILTNGGSFHQQLELALRDYLGVDHIALFANGTIALLTALKALGISGEVITTPYTFVATSHALKWNDLKPVFADIDPETLNLDPASIEAAITPRTSAILPVHCYGTPCEVDAISDIAHRHNLRVIYDAAHAFGVRDQGGSILRHGDLSILSFHATKVFSTLEGGAIICRDAKILDRINRMKNFGFVDEITVTEIGINGKLNEISAAFGLAQLSGLHDALDRRSKIDQGYRKALSGLKGIRPISRLYGCSANFGYFPILVSDDYPLTRDELYLALRESGIYARRYFYPLTSEFPMYAGLPSANPRNLPIATAISRQIICLPIFAEMAETELDRVVDVLVKYSQDGLWE